jgi:hypothetical protein
MNQTKFAVSRFRNRNGVTSWRVSGFLHGIRIRKNFKTREEAAAETATLEIKAVQIAAGQRAIVTALTEDQAREAESLFRRLVGKPHPLSFYVEFAFANYRAPETQKSIADAATEYVAAKEHEMAQDRLSDRQVTRIRYDLKCLKNNFGSVRQVSHI